MKKLILILIVLNFSCKNETRTKGIDKSLLKERKLEVVISVKVLVDDVFQVYYYEPGMDNFHSEDFVETNVIGNSSVQNIKFTLPDGMYPERLRLDFGKKVAQKEMELKGIKITYGNKEYVFTKDEIINEFKPSKFIIFDSENLIIKTQEIENRYDPYFYTKKVNNIINYLLED